jgi:hypothetical protein
MMQLIDVPVSNRAKVVADLWQQGFSDALVLWMASNLVPARPSASSQPQSGAKSAPQPLVWAFDVKGSAELYEDYKKVDAWGLLCAVTKLD